MLQPVELALQAASQGCSNCIKPKVASPPAPSRIRCNEHLASPILLLGKPQRFVRNGAVQAVLTPALLVRQLQSLEPLDADVAAEHQAIDQDANPDDSHKADRTFDSVFEPFDQEHGYDARSAADEGDYR